MIAKTTSFTIFFFILLYSIPIGDPSGIFGAFGFLNFVGFSNTDLAEKLVLKVVDNVSRTNDVNWDFNLETTKEFIELNGPEKMPEDKKSFIYSLFTRLRREIKSGTLSEEKKNQLLNIIIGFLT